MKLCQLQKKEKTTSNKRQSQKKLNLKSLLFRAANSEFAVLSFSISASILIEVLKLSNSDHFALFSIYLLLTTLLCSFSQKKSIMIYGILTFTLMLFHIPMISTISESFRYLIWSAPINLFDLTLAYEAYLFLMGCYNGLMGILVRDYLDNDRNDDDSKNSKRSAA